MMDDETDPRTKKKTLRNLEPMSLDELQAYIGDLQVEIKRAEAEIGRKKAYAEAASTFFRTPT